VIFAHGELILGRRLFDSSSPAAIYLPSPGLALPIDTCSDARLAAIPVRSGPPSGRSATPRRITGKILDRVRRQHRWCSAERVHHLVATPGRSRLATPELALGDAGSRHPCSCRCRQIVETLVTVVRQSWLGPCC
jgi:hypothetical protein